MAGQLFKVIIDFKITGKESDTMKEKKVLLSISMLISGREEMKKSLESLHYFKEAFPCEIILVDTGCNAAQRALAEQYADKIVNFTWCNDFAAARNAGLKEARGEWFLYLDDDEWFENPKEIISFFTTGEYKKYNSASYVVRNYIDLAGHFYNDSYPSRMCRLEPETKFVGKIHEYINTWEQPRKEFSDFVHHYGYAWKSDEDRKKHAERNIIPLLEMIKQNPEECRWTVQLVQEYFGNRQFEEAFQNAREWLEEKRCNIDEALIPPRYVGCIYAYAVVALHTMERYEETESWVKKALADPALQADIMEPTRAFFYMAAVRLYSVIKEDNLCREYMRKYLDCYKHLKGDRKALELGAELLPATVFQENLLWGTILMSMGALIRVEDYGLAETAFYIPDWQNEKMQHQPEMERNVVDAVSSVPWHPVWGRILQTLVSREQGMQQMMAVFLEAESRYEENGEKEKLGRMMRIIAELKANHCYILCAGILWAEQDPEIASEEERTKKIEILLRQIFERFPQEILRVRSGVWAVAERHEISLEKLLESVDYLVWKHSLEDWCLKASLTELREWEERLTFRREEHDSRKRMFKIKCLEGFLRRYEEAGYALEELEEKLWEYAERLVEFYGILYREEPLAEISKILQEDLQLALRLKTLRQYREQGDDLRALEAVRKCLGIYPLLEDTVEHYAGSLRDEIQRRNKEAETADGELKRMIESLKAVVKQKMAAGVYEEARDILLQVCQCAPEDREAESLLEQAEEKIK